MTDITESNFIKCGSPLGEFELHCTKEQMQQILQNQKDAQEYKKLVDAMRKLINELNDTEGEGYARYTLQNLLKESEK